MKKNDKKPAISKRKKLPAAENILENSEESKLGDFKINSLSSADVIKKDYISESGAQTATSLSIENQPKTVAGDKNKDLSKSENPIFRELAEPKLPALKKENRARLQMQTPTRLHFYWSVKDDAFETLHRIFGGAASNYTLVVKLFNQTNGREEIHPVPIEGSWWFNVDADSKYRAEIGFHASSRPFVRLLFSNPVETPRRNPSARQAADADWAISAGSFAQVLDNSGFAQDALEVALAGDDAELAETATQAAFEHFFGGAEKKFTAHDSGEMRFALLALASGYSLENLRGQISSTLFAELEQNAENLSAEKASVALRENFGLFNIEDTETESPAPTVFGASLINFARVSKQKFAPVSSLKVAESFR